MKRAMLCLAFASCAGTDTGNPPVIDFRNSGCLDRRYEKGISELAPDPRYQGLTCLAFDHPSANQLHLVLTNYESGCGSDNGWVPHAEYRDDGGLDLVLEDQDCASASCGWCLYDLSLDITLEKPLADGELRVYQRGCTSAHEKRATLALSQPSGVACDYAHSVAIDERGGTSGTRLMMCGAIGTRPATACDPGLQCTDLGQRPSFAGGERCLPSCLSDADCDSLSRCDGTVCRLSATGLSAVVDQ